MSDGGRESAPLGVKVWKSSQNEATKRSAVRSIAWLGFMGDTTHRKFSAATIRIRMTVRMRTARTIA
jgi:hypothetical protein